MHHFHGAARQSERHGPEGALARPVDQVVDAGDGVFYLVVDGDSARSREDFLDAVEAVQLCVFLMGGETNI